MRASRLVAGKYLLGPLLGKGGTGEVYRALQIDLDRDVALKLLVGTRDPDARTRFLREARVGADIHHPCVAQVFDAGVTEDGTHYFAMELLEGETLGARLHRNGPMEPAEAVAIVASLCLALQVVHSKGILHRDLKPSNIFLARRPDGGADPKLIDFGIAKRIPVSAETRRRVTTARGLGASAATALDLIIGTPRYLSPEQVLGEPLDARTDIYALAVTLYEMLSGTPPFRNDEFSDLAESIVTEAAAPLAKRAPEREVPAALDREVLRALSKRPELRPATAAAFAGALWTALAEAHSSPPPSPAPPPRRRAVALVITASVSAVLALVMLLVLSREPSPAVTAALPVTPAAFAAPPATPTEPFAVAPASASATLDPSSRPDPKPMSPRASRPADRVAPAPLPGAPAAAAAARRRIGDLKSPY